MRLRIEKFQNPEEQKKEKYILILRGENLKKKLIIVYHKFEI